MSDDDGAGLDLGGLLGGLGGAGGGGLGDMLAQAQAAMAASQAAAETEVEGSAGGGLVRILATGGGEVRRVTIDPGVVDPDDVSSLEDLVTAALRDLNARISRLHEGAIGTLDPSAMLGGLSGLFGAPGDDDDDDDDDDVIDGEAVEDEEPGAR